ncbi:putative acetyltransferase [Cardamine amara subsp. amara]|uniref:Acetyltransferase n=1 Tax=Cardamine amara subsp. amara TaxID=228776 RepID=A0ABD0ZPE7_CARAN
MADVVVISNTIVRPESYNDESGRVKIHLTPWDLFFLRAEYPQRGLLFPQPDPETNLISQLKSSLSVALKIFYPFAGRLVKVENEDDGTASFYIDCDGSGVKFVHASAKTVSVSDVLGPADSIVPDFLNRFFPANGVKSCEGISESLIAFQLTELKDGVFIGFGYNHMVADGSSFWNFFNTWSEICSTGFDRRNFSPLLLRGWFLDGIDYPIRIPISETEIPNQIVVTSSSLQEKVFLITSRNISVLKSKANGEVDSDDRKISSLQAISAHMWRSIIRNSDLNPEEVIHCKLLMDMRRRLKPPLEKECFGNVVGFATATTTVGEMLNSGLGWAALQINKTVGSQTNEEFREFAENWVKKPKIPNHVAVSNSIIVASSPWFNVYGNDFGWGKPIAVRAGPGNTSDGKLIVYPGIEEGNIEIQTCLSSLVLEKLSSDEEFLKHACVV